MATSSGLLLMGGALCAAGLAAAGSAAELEAISRSPFGLMEDRTWDRMARGDRLNNTHQLSVMAQNYAAATKTLPAGGTFDASGQPMHGWITSLLAVMDATTYNRIRIDLPWDAPENREAFQMRFPPVDGAIRQSYTAEGYAIAGLAANGHVMGGGPPLAPSEITDGQSTTLLLGEVFGNPQPWGSPFNWRDPSLGINTTPDGFGALWLKGGCNFGLADGSARFISAKIDPAILRKLATPRGGETIAEEEFTRNYDPMSD